MTTTYHPSVHRFAIFVVCWTILLLVAGALVTSNEAALSVPDWPLSYGTLTPPMVGGIRYEHSHRVIAGVLGLLSIVLAVCVWAKDERRWLRWFSVIAVAGIAAQAVLGGEVVRQLLHYWLPVAHACFAQIVFAALLSIAVFTSRWWISDQPRLEDPRGRVDDAADDRRVGDVTGDHASRVHRFEVAIGEIPPGDPVLGADDARARGEGGRGVTPCAQLEPSPGGSSFHFVSLPPWKPDTKPLWHRTTTLDYNILLEGELVMLVETGEVILHPGDVVVQRNTLHAWKNGSTTAPVRWVAVLVPIGRSA